jgi:hypothetical protein
MTADLHDVFAGLAAANPDFAGVAAVGESFLGAVASGVATRDMYADGALTDGLIDLWFDDGTHASKYGSYLSALTLFGSITGIDPLSLGADEIAARDLGIDSGDALRLQAVASRQLGFAAAVPEPSTVALFGAGLGWLAWRRRSARACSRYASAPRPSLPGPRPRRERGRVPRAYATSEQRWRRAWQARALRVGYSHSVNRP